MNTSYFARYKEDNGVSICLWTPKWFTGQKCSLLAPTKEILTLWKQGAINEQQYTDMYIRDVLDKRDPHKAYEVLKGKVLLCYEKPGDFCHRHIVAKWIEKNVGVKVEEI